MNVLIFGDSTVQGYFDSRGGWANRLCQDFKNEAIKDLAGDWTTGFSLGVSGDMAADLLGRLNNEAKARSGAKDSTVIVIAIGLNDSALDGNQVRVDEYEFQANYAKLLDQAAAQAEHILCVGLNAVDESMTNPWPYYVPTSWKNNRINLFEDCIKQLTVSRKLTLIPIHDDFLKKLKAGEKLLADGLHPNDAGHDFIYGRVRQALNGLLH